MRLYLAEIKDVKPEHINMIDAERRKKSERYKFEDDKKRCVLGGLLMRDFLGDTEVDEDENGKPLAKNGAPMFMRTKTASRSPKTGCVSISRTAENMSLLPWGRIRSAAI